MASGNAHFEISRHPALGCRGKGASFNQDVDSAVFSINSSACGAQPPLLPFWQHPSVHQFTATVEIQGTSTQRLAHCFVFLFQSSVCEQHFPVLPPQKVKFLAAPLGETAGLCSPPSAGRYTEGQSSRGISPVSDSSGCRGLPASPDSFNVTHQILCQAYSKNLKKRERKPS